MCLGIDVSTEAHVALLSVKSMNKQYEMMEDVHVLRKDRLHVFGLCETRKNGCHYLIGV